MLRYAPKLLLVLSESDSSVMKMAIQQAHAPHAPCGVAASVLLNTFPVWQVHGEEDPAALPTKVVLDQVMVAARRAAVQVAADPATTAAGRDMKVSQLASELNALYTIEQLMCSPVIREAVRSRGLELHAAVLHSRTGEVEFIGRHPKEKELMSEKLQPQEHVTLMKEEGDPVTTARPGSVW